MSESLSPVAPVTPSGKTPISGRCPLASDDDPGTLVGDTVRSLGGVSGFFRPPRSLAPNVWVGSDHALQDSSTRGRGVSVPLTRDLNVSLTDRVVDLLALYLVFRRFLLTGPATPLSPTPGARPEPTHVRVTTCVCLSVREWTATTGDRAQDRTGTHSVRSTPGGS